MPGTTTAVVGLGIPAKSSRDQFNKIQIPGRFNIQKTR